MSTKLITLRPHSDLLFERTDILNLCCLLRHIKFKKMSLISLQVASEEYKDKAGYTKRERPSALERRTLPMMERSL